jgi:hypothetical protein
MASVIKVDSIQTDTGNIAFSTVASERLRIDNNGNVGIGTNAPGAKLDVQGTSDTTIRAKGTSGIAGGIFRADGFSGGSYPGFQLAQSGTHYWTMGQRADTNLHLYRESGSGNVVVDSGSLVIPGGDGSIQRSGGNSWLMLSSNTGYNSNGVHLKLDNSTAAGAFYFFSVGTSILEMAGTNTPLVLQGGSSSAGVGIAFPATQSASSNANTLDDYEEGTWTPVIVGTSTAGTGTYSVQNGRYTKIGNRVYFGVYCVWSAHTGTGDMNMSGLPFTSSGNNFTGVSIRYSNLSCTPGYICTPIVADNRSDIVFQQSAVGAAASALGQSLDVSADVIMAGHYFIA